MALIIVPARFAPETLEQCGRKGIKNVIITTGGFAEIGEEGEKLQKQMLGTMKKYGINVIGPNCLGIYAPALGIDTMFLPEAKLKCPKAGKVSIFTQSGAFGELRYQKLLDGFGGIPKVDRDALAELMVRLSEKAWEHREHLGEMDINPIIANEEGIYPVDARMILRKHP